MPSSEEEKNIQWSNDQNNAASSTANSSAAQQKKVEEKVTENITWLFAQWLEDYKKKVKIENQSAEQIFSWVIKHLEETWKWDMISKMKESLWLQQTDKLTFEQVKNVKLWYEKTADALTNTLLQTTIPKNHNTAIAKTYLAGFKDLLSKEEWWSQLFSADIKNQFKKHVENNADDIESISDLKIYIDNFMSACKRKGIGLSEEQAKRIKKFSIGFSAMQQSMLDLGLATKAEIAEMNRDKSISAWSQAEIVLGSVAKLYGVTQVKQVLNARKQTLHAMEEAHQFPWLAKKLASYELDDESLMDGNEELEKKLNDPDISEEQKNKLRVIQSLKAIKKKDPAFAALMQELVDQDFTMTKVSEKGQQAYMNIMKDQWLESEAWKNFVNKLSATNRTPDQLKSIIDQLFDLSKKSIVLKNKDWQDITLGVEKHWMNEPWSARTSEAFLKHGFPLVFVVSWVDNAALAGIAEKGIKDFQEKVTILDDQDGKPIELREWNYVELIHPDTKEVIKWYFKKVWDDVSILQNPWDAQWTKLPRGIAEYKVQSKKDTIIAGPETIANIAATAGLMHAASEMTKEQQENAETATEKALLEEKLPDEYTGVDQSKKINSATVDDVNRKDPKEVEKLTEDNIKNAENDTKLKISKLQKEITKLENDLKKKDQEIEKITNQLNDAENPPSDSEKAALLQKKEKLEKERNETLKKKKVLENDLKEAQDRLDDIAKYEEDTAKKEKERNEDNAPEGKDAPQDVGPILKEDSEDKKMKALWKSLQGDTDAVLEPGATFFVELWDAKSVLPWWKHPWAKATIMDYNPADGSMSVKWSGVEEKLAGVEWKTSTIYGEAGFDELKGKVGNIIKFPKYPNGTKRNERWVKLKWTNFTLDKEDKDYIDSLLANVDFGSWYRKKDGEIDKKNKWNMVKYIGSTTETLETEKNDKWQDETKIKNKKLWYEIVEQNDTGVTIKGKRADGSEYKRTMDPDSFLMFMMDKWLVTYTQNEVDKINEGKKPAWQKTIFDDIERNEEPGSKSKMTRTTLASIAHCRKFAIDGANKYFKDVLKEENEELQDIMLSSKWFKSLSHLKPPIIGDAFDEMSAGNESKVDNKKTKEVEEAMKEPNEYWKANSAWWTYYIKEVLLDGIKDGDYSFAKKYPRKAAWYYLATLDAASNPYPRWLAEFKWKGYWVGAILGPGYQKQYLTWYASLKHYCEQNPSDARAAEELARWELQFMKITYRDAPQAMKDKMDSDYGSSFFTKVLGKFESKLFNTTKINEAKEWGKFKWFSQLYNDDFFGPLDQNRTPDMIGTLDLMGDKIKSNTLHYRQWNMCMALPILMWQTATDMNEDYKNQFTDIARKFACPFGLYGKDSDGQKRLWELFALVEKESGCDSLFFSENQPWVAKLSDKLKPRWFINGQKMLDYLTDPWKLIACRSRLEGELAEETSAAKKQDLQNKINTLIWYVDEKCLDEERWRVWEIKWDSIIYEKHIMVLSPWFVANHMLGSYDRSWYKSDKAEYAPKLWNALNKKIAGYSAEKVPPELYEYVLKKFVDYFGAWKYIGTDKLQTAIKYSNTNDTSALNVAISMAFNQTWNEMPVEVAECFRTFELFFAKEKPSDWDLYKIFGRVFGRDKWTSTYFENLKAQNLKTNSKQEQKNKEDAVIRALNRKNQENRSTDGEVEVLRRWNEVVDQTGRVLDIKPKLGTVSPNRGKKTTYTDQDGRKYTDLDLDNMVNWYDRQRDNMYAQRGYYNPYEDDEDDVAA